MKRITTTIALAALLTASTPSTSHATAIVNDPMANVTLLSQLGQMVSTVTNLTSQLQTLTSIKDINMEDLIATTGIMDTLGVADSFWSGNADILGQLQSLIPGVPDMTSLTGLGGLVNSFDNLKGLFDFQIGNLFNLNGLLGQFSNPLEALQKMPMDMLKSSGTEATGMVASLWNQNQIAGAKQNFENIAAFDQRAQDLNTMAQGATTLQEQQAAANQIALNNSHQQNQYAAQQAEANAAAAANDEAMLQMRRENQILNQAHQLLAY